MPRSRFDEEALASARRDLVIGIRAGAEHRYTPVWAVVVDGRVFVRSWGLTERSWHNAFRADPSGSAQIAGRDYRIRAAFTRSGRLLDAIDEAYRAKYHSPASQRYVHDMIAPPSRATTTELVPVDAVTDQQPDKARSM